MLLLLTARLGLALLLQSTAAASQEQVTVSGPDTRGVLGEARDTLGLEPVDGARVLLAKGAAPKGLCLEKQLEEVRAKLKAGELKAPPALPWNWDAQSGVLEIVVGTGDVCTLEAVEDFRLHLEFATPKTDHPWGNDGNSGIYIQRRYEVQILNSFGRELTRQDCGALYQQRLPDVNASRPVGEWQCYDIAFRAARWRGGKKLRNARITVHLNGQVLHDDVEVPAKTGAGRKEGPEPDVVRLQHHGNPVRFRNFWIVPLE